MDRRVVEKGGKLGVAREYRLTSICYGLDKLKKGLFFEQTTCNSGLVVEYIVAIDVTRVRFPADASLVCV